MVTGPNVDSDWITLVARSHPGSYWLVWNEPDNATQSDLTPAAAAQHYRALRPLIKAADPTAKLIVGGVMDLNVSWLQGFVDSYRTQYGVNPVVEGWHVHFYRQSWQYNPVTWQDQVRGISRWVDYIGGGEIWLTEFGSLWDDATAMSIMVDQVAWLDAQPWIARYAWFADHADVPACLGCKGSLLNSDGSLTSLGQAYRLLP